jgi:L-arabinose isomerase
MSGLKQYEAWFLTGSQHLYGEETLAQVAAHSRAIATALDEADAIPVRIMFKPVLTTPEAIYRMIQEANGADTCIGIITWMHTFSPAKMWINGLKILSKPLLHLHTQYNSAIPWSSIDMDFMNLNQSAHGDREFGFISSRMGLRRKVVAGHWQEEEVRQCVGTWARAAAGWRELQGLSVARFGDNMREVAVTEGNKVSAQIQFGVSVNGYGMGDLVRSIELADEKNVDALVNAYGEAYDLAPALRPGGDRHVSLRAAARIEIGLRNFLEQGGFRAFTDTFEDLHGLQQLPGIAVQRLMAEGYGFGAEGDWKTAALVRAMKVMGEGLKGGTTFMEDYTYHFQPGQDQVLGAHMLEICPSIASGRPSCEIHPLGIGGKEDPVRLVFDGSSGPAINASLIDLGHRFRLLVNTVEAVVPEQPLPKLPVARVLWKAHPDLHTAAAAWIYAGGAHHTCFSQSLRPEYLEDFCEMAGIEYVLIDEHTQVHRLRQELRWNELYYC